MAMVVWLCFLYRLASFSPAVWWGRVERGDAHQFGWYCIGRWTPRAPQLFGELQRERRVSRASWVDVTGQWASSRSNLLRPQVSVSVGGEES